MRRGAPGPALLEAAAAAVGDAAEDGDKEEADQRPRLPRSGGQLEGTAAAAALAALLGVRFLILLVLDVRLEAQKEHDGDDQRFIQQGQAAEPTHQAETFGIVDGFVGGPRAAADDWAAAVPR